MFENLEVVKLTHNIKKHRLKKDDKGTVVETYKGGKAYEVEFIASNGKTKALLTLISDDIRPVVNKTKYLSYNLDTTNKFGKIFTAQPFKIIPTNYDYLKLGTETHQSKEGKEKVYYHPTL